MAVLSWGKFIHELVKSENGKPKARETWKTIDTPKDGSLKVEEQEGEEIVAKEEGGAIVDVRRGDGSATVTFQLFVKAGTTLPFDGQRGQVSGEFAYRIRGLEDSLFGILIERASISVKTEMTSAEGILLGVTIKALKPAQGDALKIKKTSEIKEATVSG